MPPVNVELRSRCDLDQVWSSFSEQERLRTDATLARIGDSAGTLLDVGAGVGRLTPRVPAAAPYTLTLDFSRAALARATDLAMRL